MRRGCGNPALLDRAVAGHPLHDWSNAAGALRRSLKLYARGDRERARRLLIDAITTLRVAPPPLPSLGGALDRLARQHTPIEPLAEPVDVIVPVHNGQAHLERLFTSLFAHTELRHRIILANDGSTDPEIAPLLARAAAQRPNVHILTSAGNRGFSATVNAAMEVTRGNVAILNTDTEVPAGWLDRLLRPIVTDRRTASSTPFSNAAAIFSFPIPDLDQGLPQELGVGQVDDAFARLRTEPDGDLAAPTAIGFCMGINRAAWQACGALDEATFGRGYCEETDWCLRAAAAGWRSVLVPNLFVYHTHGGTFGDRERRGLLEANLATLHRRWPDYYRKLITFRRHDPWAGHRAAALLALAASAEARPLVSIGTAVASDVTAALAGGRGLIKLTYRRAAHSTLIEVRRGPWRGKLISSSSRELERLRLLAGLDHLPGLQPNGSS